MDNPTRRHIFALAVCLGGLAPAPAATPVSGEVFGTWTTNGSPYVLVLDCTVPDGRILTIEPAVTVIVGPAVTLLVNGGIIAEGTPDRRITIRGATPGDQWHRILIYNTRLTNQFRFKHCRVSGSDDFAIQAYASASNRLMNVEVENCDFLNGYGGILGAADSSTGMPNGPVALYLTVKNCLF